jgi:hypothetical protein
MEEEQENGNSKDVRKETLFTERFLNRSGMKIKNINSCVQTVTGRKDMTTQRRGEGRSSIFQTSTNCGKHYRKEKRVSLGMEENSSSFHGAKQKPKTDFSTFHFSKGNAKLDSGILIWNLPAISTCPGSSKECRQYCYALKAERSYPGCLPSRKRNLEFSKKDGFTKEITSYLKKRKETIIRCHESGDFWSKEYFDKWCEIARLLPEKIFYAYTKSYGLWNLWGKKPDNLILIQSVESRFPEKVDWTRSTARVIESESEKTPEEYICPVRPPYKLKCGIDCTYCQTRNGVKHVAFKKH